MSYVNVEELLEKVELYCDEPSTWHHDTEVISVDCVKGFIHTLSQQASEQPKTNSDDIITELGAVKVSLIEQMVKLGSLEDMWEVGVRDGLRRGVVECDRRLEELSQQSTQPTKTAPVPSPKSYLHSRITKELKAIYVAKNSDYGDAFGETYKKLGIISAVTRITDKVNRLQSLSTGNEVKVLDEKIEDTVMDLANYAIMLLIEMRGDIVEENENFNDGVRCVEYTSEGVRLKPVHDISGTESRRI